ncbi:MAG: S1/P1 nuclease [Gemmatimonadales bacterium]|nr:S1/P1 nuclease [Gemmatimonadales bacterium]
MLAPLLALAVLAPQWGMTGHRAAGTVTWELLSPRARIVANALLQATGPEDASVWADEVRPRRPETAPLHYVNIRIRATQFIPERDCREGCVVTAIDSFAAIVADARRPEAERGEALRFLMHFVQDMHQPLHVGENGDLGGNRVAVTIDGASSNLHRVWDTDIFRGLNDAELAERVRRRIATMDREAVAKGTTLDWAWESHALSRDVAYQLPADAKLTPSYLARARDIGEERLAKAAIRLAALIERAVGARGSATGDRSTSGAGASPAAR